MLPFLAIQAAATICFKKHFLSFQCRTGSLNLLLIATYHTAYSYVHSVTLTFIICSGELKYFNRKHKWVSEQVTRNKMKANSQFPFTLTETNVFFKTIQNTLSNVFCCCSTVHFDKYQSFLWPKNAHRSVYTNVLIVSFNIFMLIEERLYKLFNCEF
jgi:hypothetical protein